MERAVGSRIPLQFRSNIVAESIAEETPPLFASAGLEGEETGHVPDESTHIEQRLFDGRAIKSAKASINHQRKSFTTNSLHL